MAYGINFNPVFLTAWPHVGLLRGPSAALPAYLVAASLFVGSIPAHSSPIEVASFDIKRLSIEELMDIEVYSASRRLEPVRAAPSAIFVLTNDDIRRAHATSIPEALRLVPGVQVAQVDANKWAVGIRGFNGRTTNKLLVLVDGRTIYDPLFSGVLWEARDMMLEDVDRIEVVRGPGGTLWGSNAVNGVINIITRSARDTQGGLLGIGVGTERKSAAVRYGWQMGGDHHARVYFKGIDGETGFSPTDQANDETEFGRAGFRWDWKISERDSLRISGDHFAGEAGERTNVGLTQDVDHSGGNLIARWYRQLSETDNVWAHVYYDHIELDNVQLGEKRDTYDFELQHSFAAGDRHSFVWGLGYRNTSDDIRNGALIVLDPTQKTDETAHMYAQDTVALIPNELKLTLGVKLENNDYTGNEWQPNVSLLWMPNATKTWWATASSAVRVPSRLEADFVFGGDRLGDTLKSEEVDAFEIGFRHLVNSDFWYDIATFYNVYQGLVTTTQSPPPPAPPTDFEFENRMDGRTYGIELAARWQATAWMRLDTAYTYLEMDLNTRGAGTVTDPEAVEDSNPQHQLSLHSEFDIQRNVQIDMTLRFVDDLPALDVPGYTELDIGATWSVSPNVELSLVGKNLLDDHHPEQRVSPGTMGTEAERSVYAKTMWRF
jgi:iron complex outermembrane receptor protein